jgi:hypothetical protein
MFGTGQIAYGTFSFRYEEVLTLNIISDILLNPYFHARNSGRDATYGSKCCTIMLLYLFFD